MTSTLWLLTLRVTGLIYLGLGAWAGFWPASFTRVLADFGDYNEHLIHDIATFQAALGVGLFLAAPRPTWRVPLLVIVTIWNGFHTISHIVDVGDAATRFMGIGEIVLLAASTAAFGGLAWLGAREESP